MKTYTYDRLMMDESGYITVLEDPSKHPDDIYMGQGEYRNWTMYGYTIEQFAAKIVAGVFMVTEVPELVPVDEIGRMQEWLKVVASIQQIHEKGFNVTKCPCCDSQNIEADGDSEADGCEQDWAIWHYWSVWCNDCPDFKHSGKYVAQSGGRGGW